MDESTRLEQGGEERAAADMEDLVGMADSLVEDAAALKQHYAELDVRLSAIGGGTPAGEPSTAARRPPAEHSLDAMAMELALAGSTRGEVDAYLRDTFGSEDNEELLDSIFGDQAQITERKSRRRRFLRRRR